VYIFYGAHPRVAKGNQLCIIHTDTDTDTDTNTDTEIDKDTDTDTDTDSNTDTDRDRDRDTDTVAQSSVPSALLKYKKNDCFLEIQIRCTAPETA